MRKKILYFVAIATIVFFGACSNEDLMPETERTFTFAASMPDENPTTRVTLEEAGKNIELKWEEGDELQIALQQGGQKATVTATVDPTTISEDGKKAIFLLDWPEGLNTSIPFDFYGVYGGAGLSTDNPTDVILTTNPGNATSLENVATRKDVMLYFASRGVVESAIAGGVTFKHLGSLFSITLKNNCIDALNLQNARLEGTTSSNVDWAYNSGAGGEFFDMENEEFITTPGTNGNFISFSTDVTSLPAGGGVMTFVAWYPLLPNNSWPELKLVLDDGASLPLSVRESVNRKAARGTTSAVAGKNYHFYAVFNGTDLNFTDDAFVITP